MTTFRTASASASRVDLGLLAPVLALLVGGFLVFGAGFANSQTLHDAGHDSRHSMAFPCH